MGCCDEGAERGEAAVEGLWKVGEDQADGVMPKSSVGSWVVVLFSSGSERRSPAEPSGKSMSSVAISGGKRNKQQFPRYSMEGTRSITLHIRPVRLTVHWWPPYSWLNG